MIILAVLLIAFILGGLGFVLHVRRCLLIATPAGLSSAGGVHRMGEQSGHVHLREADLRADLGLRHLALQAHRQDLLRSVRSGLTGVAREDRARAAQPSYRSPSG